PAGGPGEGLRREGTCRRDLPVPELADRRDAKPRLLRRKGVPRHEMNDDAREFFPDLFGEPVALRSSRRTKVHQVRQSALAFGGGSPTNSWVSAPFAEPSTAPYVPGGRTSRKAAGKMAPKLSGKRGAMLRYMLNLSGPITDNELIRALVA